MRMRFVFLLLAACLPANSRADERWTQPLQSLFAAHCLDCHGPDAQKAGLRLDNLSNDLSDASVARRWEKIFDKVTSGAMPPAAEPRPQLVPPPAPGRSRFTNRGTRRTQLVPPPAP